MSVTPKSTILSFALAAGMLAQPPATRPAFDEFEVATVKPAVNDQPDLLAAVQQQLGLRLEATKGPIDVLIIDKVERPSEN